MTGLEFEKTIRSYRRATLGVADAVRLWLCETSTPDEFHSWISNDPKKVAWLKEWVKINSTILDALYVLKPKPSYANDAYHLDNPLNERVEDIVRNILIG